MSRDPVSIGPGASLYDALMLLRTADVTGLPVVDRAGTVIGILSQTDLARVLAVPGTVPSTKGLLDVLTVGLRDLPEASLAKRRETLEETTVEAAMSRPPIVVAPAAPLELAIEAMEESGIHRLPVVDAGRLVGIVTPTDLIAAALTGTRTGSALAG